MILALGDCNTSGDIYYQNNAYPEKTSNLINLGIKNCGYTMSTTKEMINFYNNHYNNNIKIILIQYGLVDSWKTFKYSPYVLYYPDNKIRKISRKLVKKYKKIAKLLKLDKLLGKKSVVSIEEYKQNIQYVIENSKKDIFIFLLDTVPNHQLWRNDEIKRYNQALESISKKYKNCHHIKYYDDFMNNLDSYYKDLTHINEKGHELIAKKISNLYGKLL